MARVDGTLGLQHTEWELPAAAARTKMVLPEIRHVADALFDLFQRGLRDPWQLRGFPSGQTGFARLHSPFSLECRRPVCAREGPHRRYAHRGHRRSAGPAGAHTRGWLARIPKPAL